MVENWWCELRYKLVEREAFIDSVQLESAELKIHFIFSSRHPVQKSRSGGTPWWIKKVLRKINNQAQKAIFLELFVRGSKLEGSDKQGTRTEKLARSAFDKITSIMHLLEKCNKQLNKQRNETCSADNKLTLFSVVSVPVQARTRYERSKSHL